MNKRIAKAGLCISLLLLTTNAFAQAPDARSIGMGGANTAVATGLNAVYWNPANLVAKKGVELGLFQLAGAVGNNVLTGQDILNVATADQATRNVYYDNIINAVPASGMNGRMELGVLDGFVWNNVGISLGVQGNGFANMSKDAVGFALRGQTYLDRKFGSDININGTVDSTALVAPTISYATDLWGVDAGINAKFYAAGAYANGIYNIAGTWTGQVPNPYNFTSNSATVFSSSQPSGVGFDVGLAKNVSENLRLAFVAQNLGGDVTWSGNEDVTTVTTQYNPQTNTTSTSQSTTTTAKTINVAQNTIYRVGAAYKTDLLFGPTTVALDYEMPKIGLSGIHFGIEKYFGFLGVRLGLMPDVNTGSSLFTAGLGLSLGFFNLDFGAAIGDGKSGGFGLSTVFKF